MALARGRHLREAGVNLQSQPPTEATARADANAEERLSRSMTHSMLRGSLIPIWAGLLVSPLAVAILWPLADHLALLAWLGLKTLVGALRLVHVYRASDASDLRQDLPLAARLQLALLVPDCLLWGLLAVAFVPLASPQGLLMLSLVVGAAALAVTSSGGHARVGAIFVLGTIGPVFVAYLAAGTRNSLLGAGLIGVYAALLIVNSRRIGARFVEQSRLHFENEHIAEERQRALLMAEHSNAAKSRFLAAVSHEMRTPLNGVLGMTELLQRSSLRPEQREQLRVVRRSALHLQTVIADLLDLSRVEFGKLRIEALPFELEDTVREVTELLRPVALEKGVALSVTFAPLPFRQVVGDASRIKQVLHNLIGNAIKFTEEGKVALVVDAEGPFDGSVLLSFTVRDTGIGIPAADAQHLFDAFAQGAASDRRSGTGLGLTIARQLAQAMGGDVSYQARETRGSKFVFTARLNPVRPDAAAKAESRAIVNALGSFEGPTTSSDFETTSGSSTPDSALLGRVLVADDNPVNALVATSMLQRFGLVVDVAEDGEQALEMMQAQPYDAVLMDCQMPELDGFEATRRWRKQERDAGMRHLPIVALTANAVLGDRERCLDAGMDDYLTKPFEMNQLRGLVKIWLAR